MKSLLCIPLFFIGFSALAAEYEMNELPMYGGEHEPCVVADPDSSQSAATLGWEYFYKGDASTAMKRFNQAWMFDRKNANAFWGFGIIIGQRARTEDTEKNLGESVKLLTTAHELSPENGKITGDLAFSYTVLGNYLATQGKDAKKEYAKADELFQDAYRREPKYPPITANWAILKFYTGDYHTARKLTAEAQSLGYTPDPNFLKDLESK